MEEAEDFRKDDGCMDDAGWARAEDRYENVEDEPDEWEGEPIEIEESTESESQGEITLNEITDVAGDGGLPSEKRFARTIIRARTSPNRTANSNVYGYQKYNGLN